MSQNKNKQSGQSIKEHNVTYKLMQGKWISDQDSLASITINNQIWTFCYVGEPNTSGEIYTITFKNKLPEFIKETVKSEFFILTNKEDTLKYEILGITDSTFSMMYFPRGNILLYKKKNKKRPITSPQPQQCPANVAQ